LRVVVDTIDTTEKFVIGRYIKVEGSPRAKPQSFITVTTYLS
jgi:hypothetical protein